MPFVRPPITALVGTAIAAVALAAAFPAAARVDEVATQAGYASSSVDVGQVWDGYDDEGNRITSLSRDTLHEPSGLAASRVNDDVLYVHSESDFDGMVAISSNDARVVGRYNVAIPQQWDWEDIATGPCPAGSCIFAGDIGQANGKPNPPSTFAVYRVAEPDLAAGEASGTLTGDWFRFRYPDAPHDAEAMMVHPVTGRIYVITKEADGRSGVYAFPPTLPAPSSTTITTLTKLATLDVATWSGDPDDSHAATWFAQVTAASIHPAGDRFLLRTPYRVYEYVSPPGSPFESAFDAGAVTLTAPTGEAQGEAIAYAADGSAYYTLGERDTPPYTLNRVNRLASGPIISGPISPPIAGPSGVTYDIATTCSTGTMTVRANARELSGTGSVPFSVVSASGTQSVAVERGASVSISVRGASAIPAGVSVLENGTTITSAQYDTACSAAPADEVRSKFVPLDPSRVLDTRPATRIGQAGSKPAGGDTVVLPMAGLHGIAVDAIAVVVNITATETEGPGFVQALPNGRGRPGESSNVNVERAGQTIPNTAIVRLGDDGAIGLYTSAGAHLLVDIAGYFVPADRIDVFGTVGYLAVDGRLMGVTPTRALDTRVASAVQYSGPKPGAGATLEVPVIPSATHPDVPSAPTTPQATRAGSVVLNVTATESTAPGFVQVAPGGALTPGTSSNVNVNGADQTIANLVIVPMSATGTVSIHTSGGAHLVVDVLGYFTNTTAPYSLSGLFTPLDPERVLDTRSDTRIGGGEFTGAGGTGPTIHFDGLPPGVGSVVLNVVATRTTGPGFVQIGPNFQPDGLTFGSHSNLNVERAGQTIANLAVTQADQLDIDGVTAYTSADAQLVADIFGWFTYSTTG